MIHYDEIYLYANSLEQEKYQKLMKKKMREMSRQGGYDILNINNDQITPVNEMDYEDNQNSWLIISLKVDIKIVR